MLPLRRFYFLRHGQTDWNREGRFQGHSDIPLNATGHAQAEAAGQRLKTQKIELIVASPLIRALKTAAIVGEQLSLPVHAESGIRERTFGAFDGLLIDEVKRQHGLSLEQSARDILPPDAEQWPDTVARSGRVVAKWLAAHPGKAVLFVAHDGIFRGLSEFANVADSISRHGTPYVFAPKDGHWTVSDIP